ncbi:MAG: GNAT family N-acetyltransferase [Alphaproteobacteria bacterium]|nr:GNAT family N-acetyltransferase [Alphaproteobacteria bacterium]
MTTGEAALRLLLPADADGAAEVHGAAFDEPWSAGELAAMLAMPTTFGLASAQGARLLGFVLVRDSGAEAEVLTVAVVPADRRRGIARALVEGACGLARQRGATVLFLEVAEDNAPARALYAACGFAPLSRRPGYYRRRDARGRIVGVVDALVLERRLASA